MGLRASTTVREGVSAMVALGLVAWGLQMLTYNLAALPSLNSL